MKNLFRVFIISIFLIILAVSLTGCGKFDIVGKFEDKNDGSNLTKYSDTSFDAFDTAISFTCFAESEESFNKLFEKVNSEFIRYHKLFDIYNSYDGINNIKTVNDQAGIAPVKLDSDAIDMLLLAREMYEETDGRVNVCMGSVLKLWHNARSYAENNPEDASLPDTGKLKEAALHCDINKMIIDEEACTVYLEDPEMSLDVGAIAKGYAVEKVARELIEDGINHAAINAGGNVRTIGPKPDGSWRVGIQNPDLSSDEPTIAKIELDGKSVVTSGVYERYFTVGGVRYHHIIDGETLFPEMRYLSVSVITEDSGWADALSTALFNMDYEEGAAYVDAHEGLDAIWVMPDGEVRATMQIEQ